jgi:hypothetical protein
VTLTTMTSLRRTEGHDVCVAVEERELIYILERCALNTPYKIVTPLPFPLSRAFFLNVNIHAFPPYAEKEEIYTAICIYFIELEV